ncbi:LysM peptidoglycan-binding domain-containing protein [Arthrobacter castelli]|uniref:LysM peptidoglycan-binding domain-containing protein n=1 Tax=Arthrobacter castelli TaxID=271431 RepID=UPI00042514CD|nr:LysM domain-containing protein [Arthrobacter castelli]
MIKTERVDRYHREAEAMTAISEPSGQTNPDSDQDPNDTARAKRVKSASAGTGPIIAAGVMAAGGVICAGWGVTPALDDEGSSLSALLQDPPAAAAAANSSTDGGDNTAHTGKSQGSQGNTGMSQGSESVSAGHVTVTLPDTDGNGIADVFESDGTKATDHGPGDDKAHAGGASGRGDEDAASGQHEASVQPGQVGPETYIIERGDTLAGISAETGVPLGTLVQTNDIQNPNLIYAGAALLIPQTG